MTFKCRLKGGRGDFVEEDLGKVTIAPGVLVTIVQKTADSMPGVVRLSPKVPGVGRLLGPHTAGKGVQVQVVGNQVTVDVYLVAARGVDLYQMGRQLQHHITRAIHDIVGMNVSEVNVHIEEIEASTAQQ
ncbi:MAG: Asp23/Gls24 family envelope stress response protein [Anaerolineae bacterium]|nr:Asp23/Gls24 family envelope stress response protein [Anaerolineae bacterium]